MTLKTTKEQRDALLIKIDDPDFNVYNTITVYNSVVRDLCHDADRAGELEKEVARLDDGWTEAIEVSNAFYAQTCKLQKEIADLRAKLVEKDSSIGHQAMTTLKTTKEQHDSWRHYSAEKLRLMLGKEDIDNLCHDANRARELEVENMQDYLDIERALSGQRLLYNRPLAIRVADLRKAVFVVPTLRKDLMDAISSLRYLNMERAQAQVKTTQEGLNDALRYMIRADASDGFAMLVHGVLQKHVM